MGFKITAKHIKILFSEFSLIEHFKPTMVELNWKYSGNQVKCRQLGNAVEANVHV